MNGSSMQPGDKQTIKLLALLIGSLMLLMVILIGLAMTVQKGQRSQEKLEAQLFLGEDLITKDVDMEMKHSLSRVRAIVDNGTKRITYAQLPGHHADPDHEMAQ